MATKIAIVTGSPGVGKTTLVKTLSGDHLYKIVSVADEMLPVAVEKSYVQHRDELRKLTNEQITELRNVAFENIAKKDGNIIIDTHATVEQKGRFVPGLPFGAVKHFDGKLAGLIYIDASTDDILARRMGDNSRIREKEERHVIHMQRSINISVLSYYSSRLNVPLYVITNRQGHLEAAVNDFKASISDIFK
jgi:adenylate kinase